jgi:hypothetical protein
MQYLLTETQKCIIKNPFTSWKKLNLTNFTWQIARMTPNERLISFENKTSFCLKVKNKIFFFICAWYIFPALLKMYSKKYYTPGVNSSNRMVGIMAHLNLVYTFIYCDFFNIKDLLTVIKLFHLKTHEQLLKHNSYTTNFKVYNSVAFSIYEFYNHHSSKKPVNSHSPTVLTPAPGSH